MIQNIIYKLYKIDTIKIDIAMKFVIYQDVSLFFQRKKKCTQQNDILN